MFSENEIDRTRYPAFGEKGQKYHFSNFFNQNVFRHQEYILVKLHKDPIVIHI